MQNLLRSWFAFFVLAGALWGQLDSGRFQDKVLPVLSRACFQCHGEKSQVAGLNLAGTVKPEVWQKVRGRVSAKQMPPAPLPGLSAAEVDAVVGWIDTLPKPVISSGPGRVTARRLNRVEFNNTIRDFLGVSLRPADDFPVDNQGYGFDNIGDVLSISPMLMEKFMSAARRVSQVAVYGEPYEKTPSIIGKLLVKNIQDDGHVSGNYLPFSIRGTLDGVYRFPVEADYTLQFRISNRRGRAPGEDFGPGRRGKTLSAAEIAEIREIHRKNEPPVELNIDVDGKQVVRQIIEGDESYDYTRAPTVAKVHLTAGEHRIQVYFPENANAVNPRTNLNPDGRRRMSGEFVEILGPYNPSSSHPPSYSKVFVCAGKDAACTRKIVENLARRGFRRPGTEEEIQRLLKLVALVQKQGDSFEEGVRIALQSVLVSPAFLFRVEKDPAAGSGAYRVGEFDLASRLSYFLWSSMPDEELLKLAEQKKLGDKAVLAGQVRRMLQDPKAANLVEDFAGQWLDLRALDRKKPDAVKFPLVDDELLGYMRRETQMFVGEVFREDRNLLELIDGKFTYLNGPLARYYGISGVDGFGFKRVALEGTARGGLLTHGSILALTSYATRTSPVIRGKWVLENFLGTPPPPPPPDVPGLEDKSAGMDVPVRVRLEQHRANPACAVCHNQMDPIGFGLENFDAAGGWRTKEGKYDVDSSGVLPDGRTFTGVAGLQGILKGQAALFTRNLTEKLMTFALGRGLELSDRETVDSVNRKVMANGNKLSAMVQAIVESDAFLMRKKEESLHASLSESKR